MSPGVSRSWPDVVVAVGLTAALVICSGCSGESLAVPPDESPELERDHVSDVRITVQQAGMSEASGSFSPADPVVLNVEFDFHPGAEWDAVVLQIVRKPNAQYPDGIVMTRVLGDRVHGGQAGKTSQHWSYAQARASVPGDIRLAVESGRYEMRIVLQETPTTVADRLDAQQFPSRYQSLIWSRHVTIE